MPRIRRAARAMYAKIDGIGGVVLHLDSGSYHQVNGVGALIWDLLEPQPSRAELIAALKAQVEEAPENLDGDVHEFLDALQQRELITIETD